MPSYLERYKKGEHADVWAELRALGDGVREAPVYDDALAVARETMTRARANVGLIVPRLQGMGYEFAEPQRAFVPADDDFRDFVTKIERRAGPLPLSLRCWCEVVGEVNLMGSHPKLSSYVPPRDGRQLAAGFLSALQKHGGSAMPPGADPLKHGLQTALGMLGQLSTRAGRGNLRTPEMQAALKASMEMIATVNTPTSLQKGPDVDGDPLVVEPYFGEHEDAVVEGADEEGRSMEPFDVIIAPDPVHKTGHSGGEPFTMVCPDPSADGTLEGDADDITFVEYLRLSFEWGGFPGLRTAKKPPRKELEHLTEGLLPL